MIMELKNYNMNMHRSILLQWPQSTRGSMATMKEFPPNDQKNINMWR